MNIFRKASYIRQINRCLGIKLYSWQKRCIFSKKEEMPNERHSGRTLAHMLRLCLSKGDKVEFNTMPAKGLSSANMETDYFCTGLQREGVRYVDYRNEYKRQLWMVYFRLKENTHIKLREISFT